MSRNFYGVEIIGIGKAENLLERITNKEIARRLKEEAAPRLRNWWFMPESRQIWRADPEMEFLRKNYEKKFNERYKRLPNINDAKDWKTLFEEFVIQETETDDEWIFSHTGIRERYFAKAGAATSDLATEASNNALAFARVPIEEVDGLLLATVSPDHNQTPPTTSLIAQKLGLSRKVNGRLRNITFLDGTAACSSFLVVLRSAYEAVRSGASKLALVIGADRMTSTMSSFSRNLFPILGDGAGALVLKAIDSTQSNKDNFQTNWFFTHLDGVYADLIVTPAGGSRLPVDPKMVENPFDQRHLMKMDGPAVRKRVVRLLLPSKFEDKDETLIPSALAHMGWPMECKEDFSRAINKQDLILFHQANAVITKDLEERLRNFGYEGEFFDNIDHRGNTTSASIPLLLEEAWQKGVLKPGMMVMAVVFGGGFTAAVARFRWTLASPI